MESAFYFFILGLLIFLIKTVSASLQIRLRLILFISGGMAGSAGIALLSGTPFIPGVPFPLAVYILTGLSAGFILFAVDYLNLVHTSGFEYVVTIVSGLIYGGLIWLIAEWSIKARGIVLPPNMSTAQKAVIFFSLGFIAMAGYIFPERWFRRSRERAEREE